jgi:hypothetical protein
MDRNDRSDHRDDVELPLRIASMTLKAQSQVVEFNDVVHEAVYDAHRPLIDQPRRLALRTGDGKETVTLTLDENPFDRRTSYIIDQVSDAIIVIKSWINHLMVRRCRNVTLCLERGTITGVDVLSSQNVALYVPHHNWMNVEGTASAVIQGEIDDTTRIRVMSSLDVRINDLNLNANPFITLSNIDPVLT